MRERLAFQKREMIDDGYGNEISGDFVTIFEEPARMVPGTGSETVQAARLTGVQPYTVTIRSSERTRQITTDWRAVDVRKPSRVFNILAIANPDQWNGNLNIMMVDGEGA